MRYAITSVLMALALASPAGAEPRNLSGFDRVNVRDHIAVEVRSGPAFAVDVSGPEAARVVTRVEGRELRIWERNRPWFGRDPRVNATVIVTMPSVSGLSAARGATLVAGDIAAGHISLAAAMGAELRITGSCQSLDAAAAMGAELHAENFHCLAADVSAAMGADARVFASESFDATAAMGANVAIAGGGHGDTSAAMGGSIRIADGGKADHRSAAMGGTISQN